MSWDSLWWLILGLLLGWIALWFFDKLFLRDGEVAGIRAERELNSRQAELDNAREQLRITAEQASTLQSDLVASNDQTDALRTELAVISEERLAIRSEVAAERERAHAAQKEAESARKLVAERVDEINRMKQSFIALENERDVAQRWAQAKELEVAEFAAANAQVAEHASRTERAAARAQRQILAAQRNMRQLEASMGGAARGVPRLQRRLRSRMSHLVSLQNTMDALADADQARRTPRGSADPHLPGAGTTGGRKAPKGTQAS